MHGKRLLLIIQVLGKKQYFPKSRKTNFDLEHTFHCLYTSCLFFVFKGNQVEAGRHSKERSLGRRGLGAKTAFGQVGNHLSK